MENNRHDKPEYVIKSRKVNTCIWKNPDMHGRPNWKVSQTVLVRFRREGKHDLSRSFKPEDLDDAIRGLRKAKWAIRALKCLWHVHRFFGF